MDNKHFFQSLFIFELANNHEGDLVHGLRIIREIREACKNFPFQFAFKLQYRDLDTFIHPAYKGRQDIKYVKRFSDTRLSEENLKLLYDEIKKMGFISICTPFDERSVDLIEKHDFDIIKIGSCSLTDWPLLERVIKTNKPIIASTAGVPLDDIDKVVLFFEHREKQFALMHCVGEYPTSNEYLRLNQIDLLKKRYLGVPVGYSAHEEPHNLEGIKIAIAKGAVIFEKHVGIKTDTHPLNAYSATPEQIQKWLQGAQDAFQMCGGLEGKREFSDKEKSDLRGLQRGVFSKRAIKEGEKISISNTFLAIPNIDAQMVANDMSKYTEFIAKEDIPENQPVMFNQVIVKDLRARLIQIMNKIKPLLVRAKVSLPNKLEFELSHHYGIETFEQWGAAIINCVNREYCKKLIILLPNQRHPIHYHIKKEETFNILFGEVTIDLDGTVKKYKPGEMVIIERGKKHGFNSNSGAIFEEISTTHLLEDSFYDDGEIEKNKDRKTFLTYWSDWLTKPIH
ncbi:MAG: N-acetylneuraminate synthase family protein [Candidatus Omnitrophica bacterium]|nr:N-acetylneuraminate synthase family protein [Candidatus Omnitrophota bacterium]